MSKKSLNMPGAHVEDMDSGEEETCLIHVNLLMLVLCRDGSK